MKNITQALKVVTLALILSFGVSYVYAWTAPTVTPPNGNVSAPINTSAIAQYKEGAIGIGGLIRGYANAVFDGYVGVGITIPQVPLHTAGSINAPSNSETPNGSIILGGTGTGVQMAMGVTADVTPQYGWIQPRYTNNNTNYNLVLNPNGGSVGIGVPIPSEKLDVLGNIKGTGLCIGTDCKTAWPTGGGATPPAGSEFLDTSATAQTKAGDLKVSGSIGIGLGASNPAQKLDVAGSAQITGTIYGGGSQTTYGATTIRGDKGGWSGINFAAASGVNNGTLMMHPSYSGFYNAADNNWRMYVTDAGNVYANDYFSNASGKWASAAQTRVTGSCAVGQAITAINADGTVTCASAGSIMGGLIPKTSMAAVFGNKRTEVVSVTTSFGSNCSNADTPTISGYCQMSADGLSSNYVLTSSGNTSATCGQITTSSALVTVRDGSCPARTAIAFWQ